MFAFHQTKLKNMNFQIIRNTFLASMLIGSLLLSFSSCKKEDTIDDTVTVVDSSKILVTHASPDAPGVDLLIDNVKKNSSALAFPNNTGYLSVISGTRNIKVNVAGTSTSVINADLAFTKNQHYSIFAVDSVSKISAVVLTDD
jgi:hypothetical protein